MKLGDFGVAGFYSDSSHSLNTTSLYTKKKIFSTIAGTTSFMAPEVASGSRYGFKADLFSLGRTAIQMAEGKVSNNFRKPYCWSEEFQDFVNGCLQEEKDRFSLQQAKEVLSSLVIHRSIPL